MSRIASSIQASLEGLYALSSLKLVSEPTGVKAVISFERLECYDCGFYDLPLAVSRALRGFKGVELERVHEEEGVAIVEFKVDC